MDDMYRILNMCVWKLIEFEDGEEEKRDASKMSWLSKRIRDLSAVINAREKRLLMRFQVDNGSGDYDAVKTLSNKSLKEEFGWIDFDEKVKWTKQTQTANAGIEAESSALCLDVNVASDNCKMPLADTQEGPGDVKPVDCFAKSGLKSLSKNSTRVLNCESQEGRNKTPAGAAMHDVIAKCQIHKVPVLSNVVVEDDYKFKSSSNVNSDRLHASSSGGVASQNMTVVKMFIASSSARSDAQIRSPRIQINGFDYRWWRRRFSHDSIETGSKRVLNISAKEMEQRSDKIAKESAEEGCDCDIAKGHVANRVLYPDVFFRDRFQLNAEADLKSEYPHPIGRDEISNRVLNVLKVRCVGFNFNGACPMLAQKKNQRRYKLFKNYILLSHSI